MPPVRQHHPHIEEMGAPRSISIPDHHKRLRFNEIMEIVGGVSPKSLTGTLKELQKE